LLAIIVNGVKQPTVFCPFERLVSSMLSATIATRSFQKNVELLNNR
jgi:hypothetical protein